jgi:DNA repair exonuclease SbcCD ATPase subunit/DNA repair exonuclease SbcCD nuclease subunit
MKFAHIADTHIKNLKYHTEYKTVFNKMYETLLNEKVDYIIHCGDIAHTKTQISPEFVEMAADFFINLAAIAPTYIILGNHDGNLTNDNRQDALSPIVNALGIENLHLLKKSGETKLKDNFSINVLSVFDEEGWVKPSDPNAVNIALYHGSISGVKTDTNFVLEHADHDISIFEGHDYALLGDIHKTNQILDEGGRIRYPGSTVQQNHGETNDKGFLIWNIQDKLSFDCQHVLIPNPNPFITVELEENGELPEGVSVPPNARLRLLSRNNLPAEMMKNVGDVAKEKWKPESVSFLSKNVARSKELREVVGGIDKDDLRNLKVQEQLIEEFLVNYKVEREILDKVFEINKKYNTEVEAKEEVARNVNWNVKSIEWDNLFNYGEGNRIDFSNLKGIVGIFGKNYSGKSSVIDSILYTLFNTTSKNEKKVSNVINTAKKGAIGNLKISIGDNDYVIARSCDKNIKKNGGEETKTELNFLCDGVSMNGNTRVETDQNIKKLFGTMDDFLLTSMSSQLDSLSFIREGSTKRKEILARFLDLELFDAKNKLAKEESGSLKAIIKKLEAIDYDTEILKLDNELDTVKNSIEFDKNKSSNLNEKLIELRNEISIIEGQLKNTNVELFDIDATMDRKVYLDQSLEKAVKQKTEKVTLLKEKQNDIKIIKDLLDVAYDDINELKVKKEEKTNFSRELQSLNVELSYILKQERELNNKSNLLTKVPCDTQFPTCMFIKDAVEASNQLILLTEKKTNTTRKITNYSKTIEEYDKLDLDFKLNKYDEHNYKLSNLEKEELQIKIDVEKMNTILSNIKKEMLITEDKIERYKKNKEVFNTANELRVDKTEKEKELKLVEQQSKEINETITKSHMKIGSLTEKAAMLKAQKKELENYRNQFAAYDYFMKATNSNGISYEIIKKKLPVINEEIATILSNVVDFDVFFEDDGSKLNISIQHPNSDPRPIEMGSGAEKSIAAMAIRLSLLQVSNLPKSNLFILDEPGTALDSENMEGFIKILDMIKNYYDTVLLISHMDALKDVADQIITIDSKDGFAYITI